MMNTPQESPIIIPFPMDTPTKIGPQFVHRLSQTKTTQHFLLMKMVEEHMLSEVWLNVEKHRYKG